MGGLFSLAIVFCFTVYSQPASSLLTDNRLKNKLDAAVDYAARIYLKDSNTNGISIGVYYHGRKYTTG